MKTRLIYILLVIVSLSGFSFNCKAASDDLFTYPMPPDSMMGLQDRCNYITSRFWDRCNFGTAFKYKEKLNRTFGDWIQIMQYASVDTVVDAIDTLMKRFEKKGPEALELATLAENWLYSDTSSIISDDMYLPFAKAAASNKKISRAEKARFEMHAKVIESSRVGATVPDIEYILPDGTKGHLSDIRTGSVLIFINDPDCDDCSIARVRLSADFNAKQLIERGELNILSILPDAPNDEWKREVVSYPEKWIVGAMEDADSYFDLRHTPAFFFINAQHKVLAKGMGIDYLLSAFRVANIQSLERAKARAEARAAAQANATQESAQ